MRLQGYKPDRDVGEMRRCWGKKVEVLGDKKSRRIGTPLSRRRVVEPLFNASALLDLSVRTPREFPGTNGPEEEQAVI